MIEGTFNEVKDQVLAGCRVKHPFYAIPLDKTGNDVIFKTENECFGMTRQSIIQQLSKIGIGNGIIKYQILESRVPKPDDEDQTVHMILENKCVEVNISNTDNFLDSISDLM